MNYSQEYSPLSVKEQLFFRDSNSVQDQLERANNQVRQLMSYQQQLSEELENVHRLYTDAVKNKDEQTKFLNCVLEMVRVCHPQEKDITLKYAWKWLKFVMDDYIKLKKQQSQLKGKKDSIVVGELLKKNY